MEDRVAEEIFWLLVREHIIEARSWNDCPEELKDSMRRAARVAVRKVGQTLMEGE